MFAFIAIFLVVVCWLDILLFCCAEWHGLTSFNDDYEHFLSRPCSITATNFFLKGYGWFGFLASFLLKAVTPCGVKQKP